MLQLLHQQVLNRGGKDLANIWDHDDCRVYQATDENLCAAYCRYNRTNITNVVIQEHQHIDMPSCQHMFRTVVGWVRRPLHLVVCNVLYTLIHCAAYIVHLDWLLVGFTLISH